MLRVILLYTDFFHISVIKDVWYRLCFTCFTNYWYLPIFCILSKLLSLNEVIRIHWYIFVHRFVDNEVLSILRHRFEDCILYESPDHKVKCQPLFDQYNEAAENWFIKCKYFYFRNAVIMNANNLYSIRCKNKLREFLHKSCT